MRKLIVPAVVMAVVSAVSCNKNVETVGSRSLSADAFISGSTKTDYSEGTDAAGNPIVKVAWSDEDSFKAYYAGSKNPIIFSKTAAGSSFSAADVPEGVSAETGFTGLYASKASLTSDGKIKIRFDEQNGTLENLKDFDVMTAMSELKDGALTFAFKHKCAILKVELENKTNETVKKLVLYFNHAKIDEEFWTSDSSIDSGDPNCCISKWYRGSTTGDLGINLAEPVLENKTGTYYIAVPVMKYDMDAYYPANSFGKGLCSKHIYLNQTTSIEAGKLYTVEIKWEGGYCTDPD